MRQVPSSLYELYQLYEELTDPADTCLEVDDYLQLSDLPYVGQFIPYALEDILRTPFAQVVLNPLNSEKLSDNVYGIPYTFNDCNLGANYPLINTFRILISPEVWFVPNDDGREDLVDCPTYLLPAGLFGLRLTVAEQCGLFEE